MLRFTSGYKTTDQSPHHHLLEAQQLGLVHDGEGEAAGEQRDAEEDQHGPEVADLKQTEGSQIELQTNHWRSFHNHREGPVLTAPSRAFTF